MNEPNKLYINMDATWTESLSDYPASLGYVLKYTVTNASYQIAISSSASSDNPDSHTVTIASADTATWHAGKYQYLKYVEKSGKKYPISQGSIEIVASVFAANDQRSFAQRMIDAIEATMEGRATKEQTALTINGRSIQYLSLTELISARAHFVELVKQEEVKAKIAAGVSVGNKILSRFI